MALAVTSATHSVSDDILIISAESGRNESLIEAGSNWLRDPAWTADSQRVVYFTARYEGEQAPYRWIVNRLESFDLRTRRRSLFLDLLPPVGAREVKDHPLTMAAANLTFSPDGRVLLFVTGPGPRIKRYSSGVPTFLVEVTRRHGIRMDDQYSSRGRTGVRLIHVRDPRRSSTSGFRRRRPRLVR